MSGTTTSLCDAALRVLNTSNAKDKADISREMAQAWRSGKITEIGTAASIPDRPARPDTPELRAPADMPRRRKAGTPENKIALLHALAHIELNAIDLAWDIMARFAHFYEADGFCLTTEFFDDWVKVGDEESKHFLMLDERLHDLGSGYGALPAHDGLWEASEKTAQDFAARLAIVPMVLEARGLDVTPNMIQSMKNQGDDKTADMLQIIHDDEITHVRAGTVWFEHWCRYYGHDVETYWQELVRTYFNGTLKKPFNHPSRHEAGMMRHWYEPLAEEYED